MPIDRNAPPSAATELVSVPASELLEAIAHIDALGDIVREFADNGEGHPVAFGCDELMTSLRSALGEQPEGDIEFATDPANVTIWARSHELAGQVFTVLGALDPSLRQLAARRIQDSLWVRSTGTIDPRYAPAGASA